MLCLVLQLQKMFRRVQKFHDSYFAAVFENHKIESISSPSYGAETYPEDLGVGANPKELNSYCRKKKQMLGEAFA